MRIDGTTVRDQARRQYEKVLRELEAARRQIQRFEEHDQPQFSQWISRQFGPLLTQLRELARKLQAQRDLLFEIQAEALVADCSHVRAYERVMWRREHPEDEAAPRSAEENESRHGASDRRHGSAGEPGPFSEERQRAWRDDAATIGDLRLKDLYRAVVRRLHPDKQREVTTQKREWWHQAQAAYRSGDVEQLQIILTLCEIDEHGSTKNTSVSLLMRITREFRNTLRALRTKLTGYRREPAWNFSQLRDRGALTQSTERLIQSELRATKTALDVVEFQIASWARQAQMSRPRPFNRRPMRIRPAFRY